MSASSGPAKKTVYVDVDEEITGIIDKVRSANESIIALVLPKRATVLQSIVNMKLLKRSADQSDKKVVLITSESTLMPLAGAAGLHIAANLQSRPYLPASPSAAKAAEPDLLLDDEAGDPDIDPNQPIGSLVKPSETASDPIEIDNTPKKDPISPAKAPKAKKPKKDKSKMVPNFQKFRLAIIIGAAVLVLLIVFGWWAFKIAPKATITLRTESSETAATATFTADTTADEINLESSVLPAKQKDLKKTESEKVAATGEKDNGTKAGGKVALRNCTDNPVTIPAGTGVSNGSFTFISQAAIRLDAGAFTSNGQCRGSGDHVGNINVVAQNNGDQFNLSERTYTVSGFAGVVAQGDAMSGGTSKISKVISAADVDTAKKKIADKQNAVVEEVKSSLKQEGYIGIVDTFSAGTPNYAITPGVGAEAPEVTVSGEVTYTMLGIKEDDLKKIVEEQSKDEVDTTKQSILSYGFDDATYEVGVKKRSSAAITVKTKLLAGPEIKQDELKSELAGQKSSEVEAELGNRPGITQATVKFSPFWVSKVPGKADKVTFIIEQADGTQITE